MRNLLRLMIAALIATSATPAMAGVLLFDGGGEKSGKGRTFTNGEVSVRASAWSVNDWTLIESATLGNYAGGLGVSNGGHDNSHTVDNWGNLDFLMLQFDQSVALDKAGFATGWHSMNDTDATIGVGDLTIPFTTQPGLNGWPAIVLLAEFSFHESGAWGRSGDDIRGINPNTSFGNTWLIGASADSPDKFKDGFKLSGVSYNVVTPAVPEPSTWLMLILGFGFVGGMLRLVRRQEQLAAA